MTSIAELRTELVIMILRVNQAHSFHSSVVFGGWNNGALDSAEYLDFCGDKFEWKPLDKFLLGPREQFGWTRVPRDFLKTCLSIQEEE